MTTGKQDKYIGQLSFSIRLRKVFILGPMPRSAISVRVQSWNQHLKRG